MYCQYKKKDRRSVGPQSNEAWCSQCFGTTKLLLTGHPGFPSYVVLGVPHHILQHSVIKARAHSADDLITARIAVFKAPRSWLTFCIGWEDIANDHIIIIALLTLINATIRK